MRIHILGGHGGMADGYSMTSFLIDKDLLVDAGSVASKLSIEDQKKINHILISHCHLDHIKDLAFISDNCFGLREKPFEVYTHLTVKNIIKDHLLNNIIWPDFTSLPDKENPTIRINVVKEEVKFSLGCYTIIPVKVNHACDAMGFIISDEDSSVLFTLDTGPTDRIWEIAKGVNNLKAIFTEVSFPNSLLNVALASQHHTPRSLHDELSKMPKEIPVILTHLKPNYRDEIMKDIRDLHEDRIQVLQKDGEIFTF
jgi:cAMP phosphodiesterase